LQTATGDFASLDLPRLQEVGAPLKGLTLGGLEWILKLGLGFQGKCGKEPPFPGPPWINNCAKSHGSRLMSRIDADG